MANNKFFNKNSDKSWSELSQGQKNRFGGGRKNWMEMKRQGRGAGGNSGRGGARGGDPRIAAPGKRWPEGKGKGTAYGYDTGAVGKRVFNDGDIRGLQEAGYSQKQINDIYQSAPAHKITQKGQVAMGDYNRAGSYNSIDDFDVDDIQNRWQRAAGRGEQLDKRQRENVKKYNTDIGAKELSVMKNEHGWGVREINDAIKRNDWSLSGKAQNRLNSWLNKLGSKTPTDVTDPKDGTPVLDTNPATQPAVQPKPAKPGKGGGGSDDIGGPDPGIVPGQPPKIDTTQSVRMAPQDMTVGSNKNRDNTYDGDITNSTIYGNANTGNQDFSINVGGNQNQSAFGGSGGYGGEGLYDGNLDNFRSAATSIGLMENIMNRSAATGPNMGGLARAAGASGAAEEITDFQNRNAYDELTTKLDPSIWEAKSDVANMTWAGDLDSIQGPNWTEVLNPPRPKKPDLAAIAGLA